MYDGVMVQLYAFLASVRDEISNGELHAPAALSPQKDPPESFGGGGFILLQICESSAEYENHYLC
jgi:hypothetical protein